MFTLNINQNLTLALVQTSFAQQYFEIIQRDRDYLSEWMPWPMYAEDEEFFRAFIRRALHDYADGKSLTCAILLNQQVVGNISFNTINHDLKKVEIGYWLSAQHQGQGIVTQSVAKLIDIAFIELGMEKVQIAAATGNQRSRKICERLGFSLEGIITRAENLNGKVVDHAVYGLGREQWANSNKRTANE